MAASGKALMFAAGRRRRRAQIADIFGAGHGRRIGNFRLARVEPKFLQKKHLGVAELRAFRRDAHEFVLARRIRQARELANHETALQHGARRARL